MRRPLLAWGLAAAAAAAALGALLREPDPVLPAISRTVTPPELAESPLPSPVDDGLETRGQRPPPAAQDERAAESSAVDPPGAPRPRVDEATIRELVRKSATNDVRIAYTLLLEDLGLPEQDEKDLIALLVDLQIERTSTAYTPGRSVSEQERWNRIGAVIGQEKLAQLLTLEQFRAAYWETYQIAALLQWRGAPTTKAQRDRIFDIVADVGARYPVTPPVGVDSNSVEYIDNELRQLDDFDRHVVELAPSALSATQVVYLHEAYQRMSRARIDDVERQKKQRFGQPGDSCFGWSTPGRWN